MSIPPPLTPEQRARLRQMLTCPHCVNGLQPSTHVDDEQPMKLCSVCDGGMDQDDADALTAALARLDALEAENARLREALKAVAYSPSTVCTGEHERPCDCLGDKIRAALTRPPQEDR